MLYCNTVEKRRAVSCSAMVLSVHGNSNAEEEQQETEGDDRKASEWKNKEEAVKRYLYDHKEIAKKREECNGHP